MYQEIRSWFYHLLFVFVVSYPTIILTIFLINKVQLSEIQSNDYVKEKYVINNINEIENQKFYSNDKEFYLNHTFLYKGVQIAFYDTKELKKRKEYNYNKKEIKNNNIVSAFVLEDYYTHLNSVLLNIDKNNDFYNKDKSNKYWLNLKIDICTCTDFDFITQKNDISFLGNYDSDTNRILIRMVDEIYYFNYLNFESILNHEIGHFLFKNKLSFKDKTTYIKKYNKKEMKILDYINLFLYTDVYKNGWENNVEEKVVEDIKAILSSDNFNIATNKKTTKNEKEDLLKKIKSNSDKNVMLLFVK